ncbi:MULTISPECIES: hypothetical protein [unclassified Clostridium]|uniref:hypothetical protein n=1 Tax=unclassified Clostridium TaxID=2614128 RepID=UPI00207B0687|nr:MULTISPECIES: hypothetical protein [unclassified Clostridium]
MNNTIQYGCFRYFLVPYDELQMSMFQKPLIDRKSLIENIIENNETAIRIEDNTYEGKYKLYLVSKINENNFLLQFGKHGSIMNSQDTGTGFQDSLIDDYPHIHIFINTREQILLFEKKTKAFKNFSTASKNFSNYISERIDDVGYEFKCEEIHSPVNFWNLVDISESLDTITLTLYSPNLFDGTTPAEEATRDLENATNSTENILTFKNKHGKLKLLKSKLQTFIEYIAAGGGSWSMRAKIPHKKSKKFSSKHNIKILNFPSDIIERTPENLSSYIENTIHSINHKPGDDFINEGENIKNK